MAVNAITATMFAAPVVIYLGLCYAYGKAHSRGKSPTGDLAVGAGLLIGLYVVLGIVYTIWG